MSARGTGSSASGCQVGVYAQEVVAVDVLVPQEGILLLLHALQASWQQRASGRHPLLCGIGFCGEPRSVGPLAARWRQPNETVHLPAPHSDPCRHCFASAVGFVPGQGAANQSR
ncbi:MAG: hypothetical protein GY792_27265 [Gammaproteobacteria bacterium]|nr:hypothetical protein [Gammaproteobacteria bacterium]